MAYAEIERNAVEGARPAAEPGHRQAYVAPVLNRHGSLRAMTQGSNIGQPEDFISATTAGT